MELRTWQVSSKFDSETFPNKYPKSVETVSPFGFDAPKDPSLPPGCQGSFMIGIFGRHSRDSRRSSQ